MGGLTRDPRPAAITPRPRRYELSAKQSRSLVYEVLAGTLASVFLGLGSFFLLLWAGIWV